MSGPETFPCDLVAAPGPAAARAERQLALLGRLAEIGLQVAEAIDRRAKAAGPEEDLNALAMAYARVARAVRLTVMLQSKLTDEIEAQAKAAARAAAASAVAEDPDHWREEEHKRRVERIVERVAKAECDGDDDEVERLVEAAQERLDDDDIYGAVLSRPVGELVALVCRDLGLDPDWTKLAEEAWAKAEIDSGAAGSPFGPLMASAHPPPLAGEGDPAGGEGAAAAALIHLPPDPAAPVARLAGERAGMMRSG